MPPPKKKAKPKVKNLEMYNSIKNKMTTQKVLGFQYLLNLVDQITVKTDNIG